MYSGQDGCPYVDVSEKKKYMHVLVGFQLCRQASPSRDPEFRKRVFALFKETVIEKSNLWRCLLDSRYKHTGAILTKLLDALEEGRIDNDACVIYYDIYIPRCGTLYFGMGLDAFHFHGEKELMMEFVSKLIDLFESYWHNGGNVF